ncbi:MAG: molecular chaperone TorD family protein, partial [Nitrospirae bacterium]|nr:molecular chaperone TorD family protein [Nitrospirota bacterium]
SDSGLILSSTDIMADHIGAELNFIGVLFQKIQEEPAKKLYYANFAKSFLDKHLMKWVPQFVKDMKEAAESSLYKELAQVTGHLLYTMTESL